MRSLRTIVLTFILSTFVLSPMLAQDVVRLGERDLVGTARYVGMSGAMTAIGGDPSAVRDNPAGLGLYLRNEVTFTADYSYDRTVQANSTLEPRRTHRGTLSQAALVLNFGDPYREEGLVANNVMLSYHRMRTYSRSFFASGTDGYSLTPLLSATGVDLGIDYPLDYTNAFHRFQLAETGVVNEYSLDWSMNISHQWYLGTGIHIQNYTMSGDAVYEEIFNYYSPDGVLYSLRNKTSLLFSGVGFTFSFGMIYRPCRWCRLGFSLETPSVGALNTYTSGILYAQTDTAGISEAPNLANYDRKYHSPLRLSTSLAAQLGNLGLISFQYDFARNASYTNVHSLRGGLEIVPLRGMYINAGYTYEWNQNRTGSSSADYVVPIDPTLDRQDTYFQNLHTSQYASVGIGYRGQHVLVQAAYQYRWQRLNLYAHENQLYPMNTDTHRVVLTFGWHRGWP